ncbi:hypothetical protein V501_01023 [Pseudogymnoascus sp. VKM F-4519 (FW-2642)]|nr:hypothetical protein V501_01023 [Pseudogymnoascus sp. VKM F-4519 (FW-2642)]
MRRHPYDHREDIDHRFYWNIGLCCINWLGTLASLTLYLTETTDYITSLLIDNAVHMVPIFALLWMQCVALRNVKQLCPNDSRRPDSRAGSDPALSVSQLVPWAELGDCAPPA